MSTKTYEETLDEHIAWLQKQLDEAAAFRHKREQYMHGTPLPELRVKWKPMLEDINDETIIDTAVMHLEYASHFIEEHKIGRWKNVLMPAIAAYYIDKAKKEV